MSRWESKYLCKVYFICYIDPLMLTVIHLFSGAQSGTSEKPASGILLHSILLFLLIKVCFVDTLPQDFL
jgi:hypothetical protein